MSESFEKAVEAAHDAAMAWLADMRGDLPGDEMVCVLTAALPHLTAEDLRNTPAGRALVAKGKSLGWDDAIGELRKGQGMHRALAGTLSTRKPSYEEATDDHA